MSKCLNHIYFFFHAALFRFQFLLSRPKGSTQSISIQYGKSQIPPEDFRSFRDYSWVCKSRPFYPSPRSFFQFLCVYGSVWCKCIKCASVLMSLRVYTHSHNFNFFRSLWHFISTLCKHVLLRYIIY